MDKEEIFVNSRSLDLKDPKIQQEYKESKLRNMRKRTPYVFALLILILVFRIFRILGTPAEAEHGVKVVVYFQLVSAVVPLAGLSVFLLLSFQSLEMLKFAASFMIITTQLLHIIFDHTRYADDLIWPQYYNQFLVIFLLLIQNVYILSISYLPDLIIRDSCLLIQTYMIVKQTGDSYSQNIAFIAIFLFVIETPFFLIARFQGELFYQQYMHKQQEKLQAGILNSLPQSIAILQNESDQVKFVNTPFLDMFSPDREQDQNGAGSKEQECNYLNRKIFLPLQGDSQAVQPIQAAGNKDHGQYLSLKDIATSLQLQEKSQYSVLRREPDMEEATLKVSVSKQEFIFESKQCQMVIIEDLTTAENLDKERQKNESLQIAQACISHEMKTPLRTISMYSDFMLKDCTTVQERMLQSIKTGSQLMLFNVINTLDFAQLEKGTLKECCEGFSVIKLIEDITSLERFNLDDKRIRIAFDLEGVRQYDWVTADKGRISQVYLNLLQNAIKFSEVGKQIQVACEYNALKGRITFDVTDFGQGIATEDQAKLFTQYGKIKSGESMNPNGIGLGLYICKLICQALGGKIKCISTPNVMTQFSFQVRAKAVKKEQRPLASEAEPVTLIERSPHTVGDNYQVKIRPSGPMILAAEDLAFNRYAIKHVFEAELGLTANQFLIVENGKEAIDEVVKQAVSPDKIKLVLLDFNMPKYNGLEALDWIQMFYEENEITDKPIFAFLSAYMPDRQKAQAKALGAEIFLDKPIDPEKIRELMLSAGISLLPVAKGQ